MKAILRQDRATLLLAGPCGGARRPLPLAGLFAPVYGGLVFTHYGLARLQALRSAPIEGEARRIGRGRFPRAWLSIQTIQRDESVAG